MVLWCSRPEGRASIPGWAATSFTLVSEWKKPIRGGPLDILGGGQKNFPWKNFFFT